MLENNVQSNETNLNKKEDAMPSNKTFDLRSLENVKFNHDFVKPEQFNSVYGKVYSLFKKFDKKLKDSRTKLPFDVNLNYTIMEALRKSFIDEKEDVVLSMYSENISPLNFFKLLNDLFNMNYAYDSQNICDTYFSTAKSLANLDKFYTDYNDIYNNSLKKGFCTLYLYEAINKHKAKKAYKGNTKQENELYPNIYSYMDSKIKMFKLVTYSILNEFLNLSKQGSLSEREKDELYFNLFKLNDCYPTLINEFEPKYYDIDSALRLIKDAA